jgi:WD40 repeat protein
MNSQIVKDPAKYEFKKILNGIHDEEITCIERLSNGNMITGSLDSTIRIWDPNSS